VPVHSWEPSGEPSSSGIRPHGAYWSADRVQIVPARMWRARFMHYPKTSSITSAPWVSAGRISCR
jgi:hypothetical protein